MNEDLWVDLEDLHGLDAVAVVDSVAAEQLAILRPGHPDNYLDSEGVSYAILRALKRGGYRITKD